MCVCLGGRGWGVLEIHGIWCQPVIFCRGESMLQNEGPVTCSNDEMITLKRRLKTMRKSDQVNAVSIDLVYVISKSAITYAADI